MSVKYIFVQSHSKTTQKRVQVEEAGSTLMEFSTSTQLKFRESQWHIEPPQDFNDKA